MDVVQPDIAVVCDAAKIQATHIEGGPEIIIEVLLPATSARDLRQKKALYEKTGVREYWVVDPLENYAMLFVNGNQGYDHGTVVADNELNSSTILPGLTIPLREIFECELQRDGGD